MTLEEKIAHLQTTSMEQARLEGNVIIDTHQAALEKVFEDHKAEATRQSETRIKAEAANAKLSLNQALAKSQLEIKRRQSKVQQELKDKIFEEADALIDEFMKTEAYDDFLIKCILPEMMSLRSILTQLMKKDVLIWKVLQEFS